MRATPELKTITLPPINADLGMGFLVIRDLLTRCLFDPFSRDQLSARPLSLLQVKLAELRDIFRAKLQPITAKLIAFGTACPLGMLDSQWHKQSRLQKFQCGLASHLGRG